MTTKTDTLQISTETDIPTGTQEIIGTTIIAETKKSIISTTNTTIEKIMITIMTETFGKAITKDIIILTLHT